MKKSIECKRHFKIILLTVGLGGLSYTMQLMADVGAKSMFSDEGVSVMASHETPESTPIASKAKEKSPTERTTRQNVSNDLDNASSISYAGLQYWIDLQGANGQSRQVTTNHIFHSGDGVKLQIKSKTAGYLYVINQDSTGKVTPLYPTNGQPSGLIQANTAYTIPPSGMIYFDNVPGNEKITIALTKYPLPSLDPSYPEKGTAVAYNEPMKYSKCATSGAGSKGMFASEDVDCLRSNYSAGSKGMFTQEDTSSAKPASYSVMPAAALDSGDVMFVDFNLTHR